MASTMELSPQKLKLHWRTARDSNIATKTGNTGNLWKYDRWNQNSKGTYGIFNHGELHQSVQATATVTDNWKWKSSCFGANHVISSCPSLSQLLANTIIELIMVDNIRHVDGIPTLSIQRYKCFRFWPYRYFWSLVTVATHCRSLLCMVISPRFSIEIS